MSPEAKAASRFRGLLASERRSADLYSGLADAAMGERREVLTELAAVERKHAAHWAAKLTELGEPVPPPDRLGLRTVVLYWLARRSCVDSVLPYLGRARTRGRRPVPGRPRCVAAMAADQRSHVRVIS
jgi:hypothetical protein